MTGLLLDLTGGYTATFIVAAGINLFGAAIWSCGARQADHRLRFSLRPINAPNIVSGAVSDGPES